MVSLLFNSWNLYGYNFRSGSMNWGEILTPVNIIPMVCPLIPKYTPRRGLHSTVYLEQIMLEARVPATCVIEQGERVPVLQ